MQDKYNIKVQNRFGELANNLTDTLKEEERCEHPGESDRGTGQACTRVGREPRKIHAGREDGGVDILGSAGLSIGHAYRVCEEEADMPAASHASRPACQHASMPACQSRSSGNSLYSLQAVSLNWQCVDGQECESAECELEMQGHVQDSLCKEPATNTEDSHQKYIGWDGSLLDTEGLSKDIKQRRHEHELGIMDTECTVCRHPKYRADSMGAVQGKGADTKNAEKNIWTSQCDCSSHEDESVVRGVSVEEKQERKALENLSIYKLDLIQHWVNSSHYGQDFDKTVEGRSKLKTEEDLCIVRKIEVDEDPIAGYTKIAKFFPNFKNALICTALMNQSVCPFILDSGASLCLATSSFMEKYICPEFQRFLVPWRGAEIHNVSGTHLKVLGCFNARLDFGEIQFEHNFCVFSSHRVEALLGLDLIEKYDLLVNRKGLYIKDSTQQELVVRRIGSRECPMFSLNSEENVMLAIGEGRSIEVRVDTEGCTDLDIPGMCQVSWVAHSEELQPYVSHEKLMVFFQLVNVKKDCKMEIFLQNTSQEVLTIEKGQHLADMERMELLGNAAFLQNADPEMAYLFRIFSIPAKSVDKSDFGQNHFFAEPSVDEKEIDWNEITCDDEPAGLRQKVKDMCQRNAGAFARHSWDIGATSGSDLVHFSVRSNTTPACCVPIPTNPRLLDRANNMVANLLERNLISYAQSRCAWSAPGFFLLKAPRQRKFDPERDPNEPAGMDEIEPPAERRVRLLADYRQLNKKIKPKYSVWPALTCRQIIQELRGAKYCSMLDILNCF